MNTFTENIERAMFEAGRPFAPKGETVEDMLNWLELQDTPTASYINWWVARHARELGFDSENAWRRLAELRPFEHLDATKNDWPTADKKRALVIATVVAGARSVISRSEAAFTSAIDQIQRTAQSNGVELTPDDVKAFLVEVKRSDEKRAESGEASGGGGGGAIIALIAIGAAAWLALRKKK